MAIYRFKILWEENENVERTILIKSHQTFLDFFHILIKSLELPIDNNTSASFFISDEYWDKHQEITLKEQDIQKDEKLMSKTKIASLIEQPRQRFVFIYDEKLQLTFLIELMKIERDSAFSANEELPKITSSKNKIPKRRKTKQNITHPNMSNKNINPATLSDDEIDKIIYQSMQNKNLTKEDLLNGDTESLIQSNNNKNNLRDELNSDIEHEELEDEENDHPFDEDNDIFDENDFDENNYYDETNNN